MPDKEGFVGIVKRIACALQIAVGGEIKGDTTTLEDLTVLAKLSTAEE